MWVFLKNGVAQWNFEGSFAYTEMIDLFHRALDKAERYETSGNKPERSVWQACFGNTETELMKRWPRRPVLINLIEDDSDDDEDQNGLEVIDVTKSRKTASTDCR